MLSFNELKAVLHGARFIKLITSGGVSNLPQVIEFLNKKQSDLVNDEKTINDQKTYFKCGQ